MTLREKLIKEKRKKWLDIGCNRNFEEGFYYLDILSKNKIEPRHRISYFKINILNTTDRQLNSIGKFDFVRMQHVLEHFSYEEGLVILKNINKLLKPGAFIVITVPDLRINVEKYKKNQYKKWEVFNCWAHKRISKDSPASFYFSVFAHGLSVTPHKWCYDYEGLEYIFKSTGLFKKIKRLEFNNPLSSSPFTHNRPEEDVCVIANKE